MGAQKSCLKIVRSFGENSGDRLSKLLAEEAAKNKGTFRPKVEIIGEVCESCSA